MGFVCCVPGCFENGKGNLHSFPKSQDQCAKWIAATRTYFIDSATAWKTYNKVCRKHFRESDLRNGNLLKKDVVPSQALPHSITLEHDYCVRNSVAVNAILVKEHLEVDPAGVFLMEVSMQPQFNMQVTTKPQAKPLKQQYHIAHNEAAESNHNEVKLITRSVDVNMAMKDCDTKVCPSQESAMECTSEIDNSDDPVTLLDNQLNGGECISEECGTSIFFSSVAVQETPKKPTRKYDPVARKMRYLLKRNKALSAKLKQIQSANLKSNRKSSINRKIESALKTLSMELPTAQYNFIKLQLKNTGRAKTGNRFTFDEKTLALVIYKQNPKRYNDLRKISNLPTRQTLIVHSAAIRFKEGLNDNLMNFVRQAVSEMEPLEKVCTIGWDEMSLTSSLHFDHIKDYIDGFADHGTKRTNNFATHALVFMVRGVKSSYKQPIAYFLTESLTSTELAELVRLVTSAVMESGLIVIGSVCDAVYTNYAAVNLLIGPKSVRGNTLGKLLEYTINGTKICHIFDPPHLIKSIRNNLLVKDLSHTISFNETKFRSNGSVAWNEKNKLKRMASWKDVSDFYVFNNNCGSGLVNLIPKITSEHMCPTRGKMKVSLATQVFSGTYGRNMYMSAKRKQFPNNCIGTASVLLFFNDLFDSVNGADVPVAGKLLGAVHKDSEHYSFWEYAMRMLDGMNFSANINTGQANRSNVCKHWISTLKGLKQISDRLFEMGFESIGLRRMNQDGLENHFFKIRNNCGSNPKPNARDFRSAYTTAIVASHLSNHSLKANCEADSDKYILQHIQSLFTLKEEPTGSCTTIADSMSETDSHKSVVDPNNFNGVSTSNDTKALTNFAEDEALNCVAGDVCKQILEKIKCDSCSSTVTMIVTKTKRKCLEHDIMSKQSTNNIILPKVCFINCIKKIAANVQNNLPVLCAEKDLTRKLLSGLTLENNASIGCDLHRGELETEMKNIITKFVINRYVVQVNRILSGTLSVATESADIIQKKALDFRSKKKHIGKFAAPVPPSAANAG